jgi:hypothetical protein
LQNVSANYQRLRNSQNKWYETRVDIQGVGIVNETDGLFSVDTSLEMFHGSPTIGSAVAGEIEFSLLEQSATIPNMARIQPQVRACGMAAKSSTASVVGERLIPQSASYSSENVTINTAVSVSGENIIFPVDGEEYAESEWIPQGVYFIDTRETTANQDGLDVLTIHGYDAMLKTEQEYASNETVGDNYDTAYVRAIASAIGVDVDDRTWELMGTGYIVPFPLGYTMREILGYIAASYVGCFVMTDEGKLRLVSMTDLPAETNLLIDSVGDVILVGGDSILI